MGRNNKQEDMILGFSLNLDQIQIGNWDDESIGDLLREVRAAVTREKPGTNWLGVITLSLTLVAGGGIYVQTQISPMDDKLSLVSQAFIDVRKQQFKDAKLAAEDATNIAWLIKMEKRAYEQRLNLHRSMGKFHGIDFEALDND